MFWAAVAIPAVPAAATTGTVIGLMDLVAAISCACSWVLNAVVSGRTRTRASARNSEIYFTPAIIELS